MNYISRIGDEVDSIDIFGGFGGASQGLRSGGTKIVAAANHNTIAIEVYGENFPDVDLLQADLVDSTNPQHIDRKGKSVAGRYVDPAQLPPARLAWFSPACTHHSQANAKKVYERGLQLAMFEDDEWDEQAYVNSERSRTTMSCVLRYVASRRPEIVCVENVTEVTKWGPGRDGSTFRWWLGELDKLGYDARLCWLNSMFFAPCPQSRDRLYIVAWRKGNRAPDLDYRPTACCTSDRCGGAIVQAVQSWKPRTSAWMTATWGKYGEQYLYRCPNCRAQVHPASWMALSALDLHNLGPTLGERIAAGKRPADRTWERIRRAGEKYRHAPPIVLADFDAIAAAQVPTNHRGHEDRTRSVVDALATLAQRNGLGIATVPIRSGRPRADAGTDPTATVMADGSRIAVVVRNNGTGDDYLRAEHAGLPLNTVVSSGRPSSVLAIIVPNRTHNAPRPATGGLAPVMTTATQGVVCAAAGNTSERPGQTRARHASDPLFTQSATNEFALAAIPALRGDHEQSAHSTDALATAAAQGNHQGVLTALHVKNNGDADDTAWHGIDEPLRTVTARDTTSVVVIPWVEQWQSDPVGVTEQLATITTRLKHSLAAMPVSDEPVTDEQMMSFHWRMLEPDPELRRAMAFADDFVLLGNKGQITAGLGNGVTPPVATWLTERCLDSLRGR